MHHPKDLSESYKGSLTPQLSWNNSRFTPGLERANRVTLLFYFLNLVLLPIHVPSLYPTKTPDL